jgi:hypothetical protein
MKWKIGDRVLANWSHDEYWYPAFIRVVDGDHIQVHFDDGDKQTTTADRLMPLDIEVGDRVHCRWNGGSAYYAGRVARKEDEQIFVEYEDGDEEWTTISCLRVTR